MSVVNPISANQVISVVLEDWACLDVPCPTLPNTLQAIVTKLCDEPDWTAIDYGCADTATTLQGAVQSAFDAINDIGCAPGGGAPVTDATDLDVTGITACSSDSWSCENADACFDLTNACDPGEVTVGLLFQILIDRNVAYGNVIKDLCNRITDLENTVAAQQLAITVIQSNCCSEIPPS